MEVSALGVDSDIQYDNTGWRLLTTSYVPPYRLNAAITPVLQMKITEAYSGHLAQS